MLKSDRKKTITYWLLIISVFLLYTLLSGATNLYNAEKTSMIEEGFSQTDIFSTMEYYFYTFAITQIFLVFVIKKINIKWFLTITIALSSILLILMSLTNTVIEQWIIYILSGALQAGIWGCSLKTLSLYLPTKLLTKANMLMSSAPAIAGIIAFATATLFGDNWRLPFVVLGFLVFLCVVFFFVACSMVKKYPRDLTLNSSDNVKKTQNKQDDFININSKKKIILLYVFSILFAFLITSLFYAVNNTFDLFVKQVGNFDNTKSKAFNIISQIIIVLGPLAIIKICEKHKNFIVVALIVYAIGLILICSLFALCSFSLETFPVMLVISLLFLILANGGFTIIRTVSPLHLRDKVDTGVFSTATNSSASIAAGFAPKLFSVIINSQSSIQQNWSNGLLALVVLTFLIFLSLVVVLLLIKRSNKKITTN